MALLLVFYLSFLYLRKMFKQVHWSQVSKRHRWISWKSNWSTEITQQLLNENPVYVYYLALFSGPIPFIRPIMVPTKFIIDFQQSSSTVYQYNKNNKILNTILYKDFLPSDGGEDGMVPRVLTVVMVNHCQHTPSLWA